MRYITLRLTHSLTYLHYHSNTHITRQPQNTPPCWHHRPRVKKTPRDNVALLDSLRGTNTTILLVNGEGIVITCSSVNIKSPVIGDTAVFCRVTASLCQLLRAVSSFLQSVFFFKIQRDFLPGFSRKFPQ